MFLTNESDNLFVAPNSIAVTNEAAAVAAQWCGAAAERRAEDLDRAGGHVRCAAEGRDHECREADLRSSAVHADGQWVASTW